MFYNQLSKKPFRIIGFVALRPKSTAMVIAGHFQDYHQCLEPSLKYFLVMLVTPIHARSSYSRVV